MKFKSLKELVSLSTFEGVIDVSQLVVTKLLSWLMGKDKQSLDTV